MKGQIKSIYMDIIVVKPLSKQISVLSYIDTIYESEEDMRKREAKEQVKKALEDIGIDDLLI